SPVVDASGSIYFGSEDGYLYSLNSDGALRWKKSLGGGIFATPLLATDGHLYVGTKTNTFYCLSVSTGDTIWTYTSGGQIYSSAIVSSRGIVYFGSLDGKLYALQSEDGLKVWSFATGSKVYNSPALSVDESVVYFGTLGGVLYAADAKSGSELWQYSAGSTLYSSPAVDSAGTIYFAAQNGHVYALASDGTKAWEFDTGSPIYYSSPAIYPGNAGFEDTTTRIFIGTDGGKLHCLNAATGVEAWQYDPGTGGAIRNAPLVASNALIYFGTADSIFYCVDTTGSLQWYHKVGDVLYSSPALSTTGQLFIGAYDNKLYALGFLDRFMAMLAGMSQPEYSGDIAIGYSINNPANQDVGLLAQYSTDDGQTWDAATVTGDTSGIAPNSSGSIVWNSASDLLGEDLPAVRFKLEPYDQDSTGIAGITPAFHLDNNALPVISTTAVPGEHVGDITIPFTYSDAEGDTLTLSGEYQLIGSDTWSSAILTGDLDSLAGSSGQVTWPTLTDLADSAGMFYLRLFVLDNDPSEPDTLTLHVDNYHLQAIALTPLPAEQSGSVLIDYLLTDTSQDTLDLICEYRLPKDTVWSAANVSGDTTNIGSAGYDGSVTWLSTQNLSKWDIQGVLFKITPDDDWGLGTADSISLHIDNNAPPTAALDSIIGDWIGVVPIVFNLTDPESDTLSLTAEYRLLGAQAWETATTSAALTGITDYSDTLFWDSDADLPELFIGYIDFKVTPADLDPGQADSTTLLIDQVGAPVIVTLSSPQGEQSGDIQISFTVRDDESDAVELQLEYSLDGGINWEIGTISGQTSGLDADNYSGSFTWHSATDLPGEDHETIRLKLTPRDDHWGGYLIAEPFHLDNNQPPVFSCIMAYQEVSGNVEIPYRITDDENDSVDVIAKYSDDNQITWIDLTTASPLTNITSTDYQSSLTWRTTDDLPGTDLDSVWIRFEIEDKDPGTGDLLVLHVDNEVGPTITQVYPEASALSHWQDSITVDFSLPLDLATLEGNVTVSGAVSGAIDVQTSLTGNELTLIPNEAFTAHDTITIHLKGLITDTQGVGLDGNANGDPDGSPTDDYIWTFTTTILGDYDLDEITAFTDLILFRDAWFANPQPTYYELAPYSGQVPFLQVLPDNGLDYLDLAVLARMWNWSISPNLQVIPKLAKGHGEASPFTLSAVYDENNYARLERREFALELALGDQPMPTGFELVLALDPDIFKYEAFTPLGEISGGQENWLILDSYNQETGILVLSAVDFSASSTNLSKSSLLGRLEMEVISQAETDVAFEYILAENGKIRYGQQLSKVSTAPPLPTEYALHQNFPNPFNPTTRIRYDLPKESLISLVIYNLLGQEVRTVKQGTVEPGYHEFVWDGRDRTGRQLSSGLYFARLLTPKYHKTVKMVLLK
ncbi:MAG: PQQ-binding-like beta-propeller repeat protein, partial [Candidatus Neomarinimicrobiota bacterium]